MVERHLIGFGHRALALDRPSLAVASHVNGWIPPEEEKPRVSGAFF
jgi:hypothetical protein